MNNAEVIKRILNKIFEEGNSVIDFSKIEEDKNLEEYGMDSLYMIKFLVEIEGTFDVEIDEESLIFENFNTISKIVKYIERIENENKTKNEENPILLGKVRRMENDALITGHLGDVEKISLKEYYILKSMTGFSDINQIAMENSCTSEDVHKVYSRFYKKEKMVSSLKEWNTLGWCKCCNTYVSGNVCGICGNEIKKIIFAPPCDPFICFDEERRYIIKRLKQVGINLDKDSLLIANNGCDENKFFWEVAYSGEIILRIDFCDVDEASWRLNLLCTKEKINRLVLSKWNLNQQEQMIRANQNRQKILFDKAEVFIKECSEFMKTKPLIYFSGGKESIVMLSLFSEVNVPANVVTVATGVDFPDDAEFTKNVREEIDAKGLFEFYYYEDDERKVLDTLREKKVLSANDPWCRVDFKRKLKTVATEHIYGKETFVAAEGSRWYENDFRRRHTKVNYIKDYAQQVWIHPIAEWTSFDVWLYIFAHKLPINPVYNKGFQRTTCWLCPIVNPFHLRCSRKYYKELWSKIPECKLEAFGEDKTKDLPF